MPVKGYLISISFFFWVLQIYHRLYFIGFWFPHYRQSASIAYGGMKFAQGQTDGIRTQVPWLGFQFNVSYHLKKKKNRNLFLIFLQSARKEVLVCKILFIYTEKLIHMKSFNSLKFKILRYFGYLSIFIIEIILFLFGYIEITSQNTQLIPNIHLLWDYLFWSRDYMALSRKEKSI